MKRLLCVIPLLYLFSHFSFSQSACGDTQTCVTSFSLSPGEIPGDNLHVTYATVSATLAEGADNFLLEFWRPDSMLGWICYPPAT